MHPLRGALSCSSSPKLGYAEPIRYLAASQSFQRDTEVVLLTTNLLKKEFGSLQFYDIGQALNCMMNIVNKDLARDLLPDTVRRTEGRGGLSVGAAGRSHPDPTRLHSSGV